MRNWDYISRLLAAAAFVLGIVIVVGIVSQCFPPPLMWGLLLVFLGCEGALIGRLRASRHELEDALADYPDD